MEETAPSAAWTSHPISTRWCCWRPDSSRGDLLQACLEIEILAGRVRRERWDPRTLDIDIVRYGDRTVREPDLTIPHPGIADRDFWQRELAELEGKLSADS